jgi:glycerol-3-phosphate acyltransferase PlsX
MITIAVDAMGGDNAPIEVEGSVLAARTRVRVILVGQPRKVKAELARHDRSGLKIEIIAGE